MSYQEPQQYEYEWYKIEQSAATKIQAKFRMLKVIYGSDPRIRVFKPIRLVSSSDLDPGCNYTEMIDNVAENVAELGLCCSPTASTIIKSSRSTPPPTIDDLSPINLYKTYSAAAGEAISAMGFFEEDGRHFTLEDDFVENDAEIEVLVSDEEE